MKQLDAEPQYDLNDLQYTLLKARDLVRVLFDYDEAIDEELVKWNWNPTNDNAFGVAWEEDRQSELRSTMHRLFLIYLNKLTRVSMSCLSNSLLMQTDYRTGSS
ncbi:hypothetical protein [Furfurilactobacillus entadae]|uniref:hypothetical protein n=1 Tax=Furfurilactobacillus entadae TaxID=2922307 RepID=UPI0035ED05AF